MSGCLFKNERKRNDKDPGWQGQGETDDGRGFWIAAWVNEDRDGNKRINMKFTFKDDRSPQQRNRDRTQNYRGGGNNERFDDHDRQRGQQRNMQRRDPGDNRQGYGSQQHDEDFDEDSDIPF